MTNRSAAVVITIALAAICLFAGVIQAHAKHSAFHRVIGLELVSDDSARAAEVPIIIVNMGKMRQQAVASWDTYQRLQAQVDGITITADSSADDANRKVGLMKATEHARTLHQQDWNHLRYACRLLRGYPAATRTTCPAQ